MSSIQYNHSNSDGRHTVAVNLVTESGEQISRVVPQGHPNFKALVEYLISTEKPEVDYVHGLVDPSVSIGRALAEEFDGRITFDTYNVFLDGLRLAGPAAKAVVERLQTGMDWKRYVRFLFLLEQNPSKRAKEAVWGWIEKHGVSIAEDGRMVGYKGLVNGTDAVTGEENVPVSYHSGANNFVNGVLFGETGVDYQVPHRTGDVISKRRADVDDNNNLACSTGLHVGAYSYAKTFGENREDGRRYSTMGKMADSLPNSTFALVAFSPQDVVSVPDGDLSWKIRVSKYQVMEFLEEVKDVLDGNPEYAPANVEVPVKTSAPFIPASEKSQQESTEPAATGPEIEDPTQVEPEPEVEEEPEAQTEPDFVPRSDLVEPTQGTGLLGKVVLKDWATANPGLARDLANSDLGNTAVARKYSDITTESSVRRYRKAL